MNVHERVAGLLGVEVHRLGGLRFARMLDILERNAVDFARGVFGEWMLVDVTAGSTEALIIVRELKARRRAKGREAAGVAGELATGAVAGTEPGKG